MTLTVGDADDLRRIDVIIRKNNIKNYYHTIFLNKNKNVFVLKFQYLCFFVIAAVIEISCFSEIMTLKTKYFVNIKIYLK